MKKFAVSSLAAALWLSGAAEAQSPFFQPAAGPIQPVAARTAPPPQMPPGGVVPVRVHFGGALTRDGVVPVHLYTNQPVGMPAAAPAAGTITRVQHEALGQPSRKGFPPPPTSTPEALNLPKEKSSSEVFVTEDAYAPEIHDPRFVAPDVEHMHRPRPAPCGYRWYTAAEYLHWWTRPIESPVLLLVGGTPVSANDVDAFDRQGGRLTIGRWINRPHGLWAVEATGMFTGYRRTSNTYVSNGVTRLEHPFIDAGSGGADSLLVAIDPPFADPRSGSSTVETASRMWGFEVNLRRELIRTCHGHLDLLLGYRQFHLDEAIAIRDRVVYDASPNPLAGATVVGVDEFGAHNRLFAGQIGLDGEYNWRKFYVGAFGKFAVGSNEEIINVSGWTHVRPGPGPGDFAGSLYTQPSNIGQYADSQLTVLPEVGVNVGYKLTSNLRMGAGYNFLYVNNVVRPGDAIDTTVSAGQIPQLQPLGPALGGRPAPPSFTESAYWAHGLTVHMEIRY